MFRSAYLLPVVAVGPIWTVQVVTSNLRGRPEFTVAELLEGRTAVTLPPASARACRSVGQA
jgi:hypothetical protein